MCISRTLWLGNYVVEKTPKYNICSTVLRRTGRTALLCRLYYFVSPTWHIFCCLHYYLMSYPPAARLDSAAASKIGRCLKDNLRMGGVNRKAQGSRRLGSPSHHPNSAGGSCGWGMDMVKPGRAKVLSRSIITYCHHAPVHFCLSTSLLRAGNRSEPSLSLSLKLPVTNNKRWLVSFCG